MVGSAGGGLLSRSTYAAAAVHHIKMPGLAMSVQHASAGRGAHSVKLSVRAWESRPATSRLPAVHTSCFLVRQAPTHASPGQPQLLHLSWQHACASAPRQGLSCTQGCQERCLDPCAALAKVSPSSDAARRLRQAMRLVSSSAGAGARSTVAQHRSQTWCTLHRGSPMSCGA